MLTYDICDSINPKWFKESCKEHFSEGIKVNNKEDVSSPPVISFPIQSHLEPEPIHSHFTQPSEEVITQGAAPNKVEPSTEDDQDLRALDEFILKTGCSWINQCNLLGIPSYDLCKENNLSSNHPTLDQNLKGHNQDTTEKSFPSSLPFPLEPFPVSIFVVPCFPFPSFDCELDYDTDYEPLIRDVVQLNSLVSTFDSSSPLSSSITNYPFPVHDCKASLADHSILPNSIHDSPFPFPSPEDLSISYTVDFGHEPDHSEVLKDDSFNGESAYFSIHDQETLKLLSKSTSSSSSTQSSSSDGGAKCLSLPDQVLISSPLDFPFHPTLTLGDESSACSWDTFLEPTLSHPTNRPISYTMTNLSDSIPNHQPLLIGHFLDPISLYLEEFFQAKSPF